MHLYADMVCDEPHNPLGVGRGHPAARIFQPTRQPVDPEPAVGIEHHFDDARVFEVARDCRPERGAQHARAAGKGSDRSEIGVTTNPTKSPHRGGWISGVD